MDPLLLELVNDRTKIQKSRIQWGNRLSALERRQENGETIDPRQARITEEWATSFLQMEKRINDDIEELVREHHMYPQLTAVKGIGPMMAAKLVSMIDIEKDTTVSALWRFAGYAVFDGQRERPIKGERLHYNKKLKAVMYNIAGQFLKSRSPYAAIFYEWREYYKANRDWTDNHCRLAAIRKMNRVFLEHLWRQWRTAEGLSAPEAYVFDVLRHNSYMKAEDFGWPDSSKKEALP